MENSWNFLTPDQSINSVINPFLIHSVSANTLGDNILILHIWLLQEYFKMIKGSHLSFVNVCNRIFFYVGLLFGNMII